MSSVGGEPFHTATRASKAASARATKGRVQAGARDSPAARCSGMCSEASAAAGPSKRVTRHAAVRFKPVMEEPLASHRQP